MTRAGETVIARISRMLIAEDAAGAEGGQA